MNTLASHNNKMKPTRPIITLAIFAISNFIIAQTRIESLDIKSYIVELGQESHNGEGNKPFLYHLIQLEGTPGNNQRIKQMEIRFYQDNDERSKFKPHYNETTNTVHAHFPASEFSAFYEMLKHKRNGLRATYIHSPSFDKKEVKLTVFGKVPMG